MFYQAKLWVVGLLTAAFIFVTGCSKESDEKKQLPEPKMFTVDIANISAAYEFTASGVFNTPVGASQPGPLLPGNAYEFSFSAAPGARLSFATMFVPSNDFFYAPDEMGIALFDGNGNQITGDITAMIQLWDAGTEINQEPGLGADQPQRQSGPNTGMADPVNMVRLAPDDFNNLPAVNEVIKVTLISTSATGFKLRIENISTSGTLMTSDGMSQAVPLAPGVWVVHSGNAPLFSNGQPDRGDGLEALAEDGDPAILSSKLASKTGITTLLAPGVWVTHTSADPIFTAQQPDRGEGLEALAEDGDPSALAGALTGKSGIVASGVFNTPVGAGQPGPLTPGNSYRFSFSASPGEKLSFATMFVQSNDLFYAPDGNGITLFEVDGQPVSGEITTHLMLWDAGTEVNEEPGVGLNQAPRQAGPNTGPAEGGNVRPVNDGFSYPNIGSVLRVTITPQ